MRGYVWNYDVRRSVEVLCERGFHFPSPTLSFFSSQKVPIASLLLLFLSHPTFLTQPNPTPQSPKQPLDGKNYTSYTWYWLQGQGQFYGREPLRTSGGHLTFPGGSLVLGVVVKSSGY